MKKIVISIFKFFKFVMVGVLILLIIFISGSCINNQIQLKKEKKFLISTGKLVNVNGNKIHVYSEGKKNLTCVFMSGLGIAAPEIEMKGLYENLSDEYRIAVVDRLGYGFSDTTNDSRDIDVILEETRKALSLAGEKPPYVLFPHSISGLEATYWAQKYPDEIKAIIGLDIDYPEAYVEAYKNYGKKLKSNLYLMKLQSALIQCGIHRLFPSISLDDKVLKSNFLSENDKKLYKALTYKKLLSKNVINEFSSLESNSKKSTALKLPTKTPICIFLSVPETEDEKKKKSASLKKISNRFEKYTSKFKKGKLIYFPSKHSIYLYSPEHIAKLSKDFIKSIHN